MTYHDTFAFGHLDDDTQAFSDGDLAIICNKIDAILDDEVAALKDFCQRSPNSSLIIRQSMRVVAKVLSEVTETDVFVDLPEQQGAGAVAALQLIRAALNRHADAM